MSRATSSDGAFTDKVNDNYNNEFLDVLWLEILLYHDLSAARLQPSTDSYKMQQDACSGVHTSLIMRAGAGCTKVG